jgi:hypothetical protein
MSRTSGDGLGTGEQIVTVLAVLLGALTTHLTEAFSVTPRDSM